MSAVKIFAFLELEPRLNIKYGFNWAGKTEHFSKVSDYASCSDRSSDFPALLATFPFISEQWYTMAKWVPFST